MIEAIQKTWNETMSIPEARWIVWLTVLVILILVAVFVAKTFRDMAVGGGIGSADLVSDFEKLRREGKLDENEYQKLKSSLAEQQKQLVNKETKEKD